MNARYIWVDHKTQRLDIQEIAQICFTKLLQQQKGLITNFTVVKSELIYVGKSAKKFSEESNRQRRKRW
jgi:hypothetical protein